MPFTRAADGTRLFYEVAGGGLGAPAVLLLMGLGLRGELWGETRDRLAAAGYRVVTMDNRGVGESVSPQLRQTTDTMAEDALTVLRAAFARRAHVVGVSLGGLIAQRLAVLHPGRVHGLVLQSTAAAIPRLGFRSAEAAASLVALARSRVGETTEEERVRAALRLLTTREHAAAADLADPRLAPYLAALREGAPGLGWVAQSRAGRGHRDRRDLGRIAAPTLVQHGDADQVVPVSAGRALAERIAGARFTAYAGAGHLLALQRPDSVSELEAFLAGVAG